MPELIMNNAKPYFGKIDNNTKINVGFYSVFVDKDSPETYKVNGYSNVEGAKADFEGAVTFNPKRTKKFNESSVRFYDYKFSEKGSVKHNGVFSG
ncbi:hypothetical protein [Chryseobacterium sp. SC28]|uniref:hypothetical protein n=1 Tax=Chryseobacterium sp. SC28 TaxID=2268028 RepID=UPI000F64D5B4|nr:hypothetical protein [Chryseobacterium sp. SC28]